MEEQDYYDLEEGNHTQFHGSIHFFNIYKRSLEKISEEPLSQQSFQKQEAFANTSLSLQKKSKSLLMSKEKNQSSEIRVSMEFMVAKHKDNLPQQKTYALSKDFFSEQESNYQSSPDIPTPDFNALLRKQKQVNRCLDYDTLHKGTLQLKNPQAEKENKGQKKQKSLNNKQVHADPVDEHKEEREVRLYPGGEPRERLLRPPGEPCSPPALPPAQGPSQRQDQVQDLAQTPPAQHPYQQECLRRTDLPESQEEHFLTRDQQEEEQGLPSRQEQGSPATKKRKGQAESSLGNPCGEQKGHSWQNQVETVEPTLARQGEVERDSQIYISINRTEPREPKEEVESAAKEEVVCLLRAVSPPCYGLGLEAQLQEQVLPLLQGTPQSPEPLHPCAQEEEEQSGVQVRIAEAEEHCSQEGNQKCAPADQRPQGTLQPSLTPYSFSYPFSSTLPFIPRYSPTLPLSLSNLPSREGGGGRYSWRQTLHTICCISCSWSGLCLSIDYSLTEGVYNILGKAYKRRRTRIGLYRYPMLNQPINQVKMTNVAIIKYKVSGKIFQIACYRNKAINWRNGVEADLDEVLQYNEIYSNVSKGDVSSQKDLAKYFPEKEKDEIVRTILSKGDLQITDKEREAQLHFVTREIVSILTEKCVHSSSKRPIAGASLEQAIKDIHFKVRTDQPAKRQALACLKRLEKKFLIMRAQMKLRLVVPLLRERNFLDRCQAEGMALQDGQIIKEQYESYALIDSNKYRGVEAMLKQLDGYVEVLENVSAVRQVTDIESETVNLQVRPDFDGDLSDSQEEDDINSVVAHFQANQKKKQKKKRNKEIEKQTEPVEEEPFPTGHSKKGKLAQLKQEEKNQSSKGNEKKKQKDKLKEQQKQQYQEKEQQKKEAQAKQKQEQEALNKNLTSTAQVGEGARSWSCSGCVGAVFSSSADYRQHFKSEWHLYNLKRKMNKEHLLDFEQFRESQLD